MNLKRVMTIWLMTLAISALLAFYAEPLFANEVDGATPFGSLLLDSGKLYGMTATGGDSSAGTVFSMNTDGTGYTLLYSFTGGSDGAMPTGSLIVNSGTLYGMTYVGGDSSAGTIFSMNTSGTGFATLHEFTDVGSDGSQPFGSLIINSGTLYGMTTAGGTADYGTIFSTNTTGTTFNTIYSFTGGSDGYNPKSSLALDSSTGTLYGMTFQDSIAGGGVIFSTSLNGSVFTPLHNFAVGGIGGANPFGAPILDSGKLYGMTLLGGDSNLGAIFSMNTNGTGFTVLHPFAGGSDGAYPMGDLVIDPLTGKLYGMTSGMLLIGPVLLNYGTIFSIDSDGTDFLTLYQFTGGNDGGTPFGSLILDSGKLYGMTYQGGANYGTAFSIDTDGSDFALLHSFGSELDAGVPEPATVAGLLLALVGVVAKRLGFKKKVAR